MSVLSACALGACDDVFGLTRHVDAAIDTPNDSTLGGPDAPTDAVIDGRADAAIDAPPGAVCPAGYGPVMGVGSYRFVTVPASWTSAEALCEADAVAGSTRFTHLAVIGEDLERSRLNATFPMRSWIGASDRTVEGMFAWVTAGGAVLPPSGSPWSTGEPDHANPTDDCVEMGLTGDYAESDCAALLVYWCECDANAAVPTTR
jgi:hypothetical protein